MSKRSVEHDDAAAAGEEVRAEKKPKLDLPAAAEPDTAAGEEASAKKNSEIDLPAAGEEERAEENTKIDLPAAASEQTHGAAPHVFLLSMTTFLDDWKLRGNSWSTPFEQHVFATRKGAEQVLAKLLLNYMFNLVDERYHAHESPPFTTPDRWTRVGDQWTLKLEHTDSLQAIEEELNPFIEGECVPVTLKWCILELNVEA
jgi:hypothetical protein